MIHLKHHRPRILVVGDILLDHYLWGTSSRISPEAPVPVVDVGREAIVPGGAGNVINNLLALGTQVVAASVIGDDASGHEVKEMLARRGVATSGILHEPDRITSRKTRVVAAHQQVVRFDHEALAPIRPASEAALLRQIQDAAPPVQLVLLSDYNKGVLTARLTQEVIHLAREWGVPVLVDPKGNDYTKYRGATLLTPNKKEAAQAAGLPICDEDSLRKAGEALRRMLDLPWLMITLGDQGLALFHEGMTHLRAVARDVYDVTGAGDTVLATMGYCLACGLAMPEAAHLANSAAAVVVGKLGTATVTWDEVLHYAQADSPRDDEAAIQSPETIELVAQRLRRQGKKLVFTNGCFDLLHRGHVEYLRVSRACGDVLIVGLNSDASVRRMKGAGRPVVNQEDRACLLAALRCVDHVVVFEEDTPHELIRRIRPDVLTKGADYAGRKIVGSELAGEVRLIELVEGQSTTVTINRIRTAA